MLECATRPNKHFKLYTTTDEKEGKYRRLKAWGDEFYVETADEKKARDQAYLIPVKHDLNLTDQQIGKHQAAIDTFLNFNRLFQSRPRVSDIRVLLSELQDASNKFIEALEKFKHPVMASYLHLPDDVNDDNEDLSRAIKTAKKYRKTAYGGQLQLNDKKDKKLENFPRIRLIKDLRSIWKPATGDKAKVSKHFVEFVWDHLVAMGHSPQSFNALKQTIKKVVE
jgi:hypothetical protein